MDNLFEKKRKEILKKGIKFNLRVSLFCLVMIFFWYYYMLKTIEYIKGFLLYIIIFLIILIYHFVKYIHNRQDIDDFKKSEIYQKSKKYNDNYLKFTDELSKELAEDCLFQEYDVYITKNWIINMSFRDMQIAQLDELVLVCIEEGIFNRRSRHYRKYERYKEQIYCLKCYLKDGSLIVFPIKSGKKAKEIIKKLRDNIVFNDRAEILMKDDRQLFISNIEKGILPTKDGKWPKDN